MKLSQKTNNHGLLLARLGLSYVQGTNAATTTTRGRTASPASRSMTSSLYASCIIGTLLCGAHQRVYALNATTTPNGSDAATVVATSGNSQAVSTTAGSSTSNTGLGSCPCFGGAQALLDSVRNKTTNTLQFQGIDYPNDWGAVQCRAWDITLQPYCADTHGKAKKNAPQWCRDSWCWIDATNCDLPIKSESSYFPKSGLVFSYQTCGDKSTFSKWASQPVPLSVSLSVPLSAPSLPPPSLDTQFIWFCPMCLLTLVQK